MRQNIKLLEELIMKKLFLFCLLGFSLLSFQVEAKSGVYFKNCKEARSKGYSNIKKGEPGYRPGLDRDKDGIACESR